MQAREAVISVVLQKRLAKSSPYWRGIVLFNMECGIA